VSTQLAASGKVDTVSLRYTLCATDASAAPSRVLGTLTGTVRLPLVVYYHYTILLAGIGSGQRQLIAVTCIAEHA